jgi:hypothetical protein
MGSEGAPHSRLDRIRLIHRRRPPRTLEEAGESVWRIADEAGCAEGGGAAADRRADAAKRSYLRARRENAPRGDLDEYWYPDE